MKKMKKKTQTVPLGLSPQGQGHVGPAHPLGRLLPPDIGGRPRARVFAVALEPPRHLRRYREP